MEMVFKVPAMAILGEHLSFLGYLPCMQKLYMILNFCLSLQGRLGKEPRGVEEIIIFPPW